jgi:hypothetical protein
MLHPGLRVSRRTLEGIVGVWEDLLPAGRFTILEDPALRHPDAIQGFGLSAFVDDGFVDEFLAAGRNYLDAAFYERVLFGRSPILSTTEIGKANAADGLSLVVLTFGLRNYDVSQEQTQRVLQAGSTAFYATHAGYRLKCLVNEVFGGAAAGYMEAGGFRLCVDGRRPGEAVQDLDCPYLFAQRRDWIRQGAVHPLSFLFYTPAPRIGFSPAEQRVLVQALSNKADSEIAASLGVSLDAIKKTWRRIYERVSWQMPFLIAVGEGAGRLQRRSAEKRRHLLEYLRAHLEEVRPWTPAGPSQGRARIIETAAAR